MCIRDRLERVKSDSSHLRYALSGYGYHGNFDEIQKLIKGVNDRKVLSIAIDQYLLYGCFTHIMRLIRAYPEKKIDQIVIKKFAKNGNLKDIQSILNNSRCKGKLLKKVIKLLKKISGQPKMVAIQGPASLAIEIGLLNFVRGNILVCLLYTSPSPRDLSTSRMPSSA